MRISEMGNHVPWKLKFRVPRVRPGQLYTVVVISAYPFRGEILNLDRPECFSVRKLRVGREDQIVGDEVPGVVLSGLVGDEVPGVVLSGQKLTLSAAAPGVAHELEVRNTSDGELSFFAELLGLALVEEGETPREVDWEEADRSASRSGGGK